MPPLPVRTPLHGSDADEGYLKRFGEFLKAEFYATYEGLAVAVAGSQEITTYSFRVRTELVALELETYVGVSLVASHSLTENILRAARAAGLAVSETQP